MHESLPKVYTYSLVSVYAFVEYLRARMAQGDLQELLGQVPTYTSPVEEHSSTGLPHLPNNSEHAYHLVVMYAISFFLIPSRYT
jgi:hypothetical protein